MLVVTWYNRRGDFLRYTCAGLPPSFGVLACRGTEHANSPERPTSAPVNVVAGANGRDSGRDRSLPGRTIVIMALPEYLPHATQSTNHYAPPAVLRNTFGALCSRSLTFIGSLRDVVMAPLLTLTARAAR